MSNNVSAIIATAARRRHRSMANNVSAIIAAATWGRHRPMREQLEAASISDGAQHKRQNNYCADCTTQ